VRPNKPLHIEAALNINVAQQEMKITSTPQCLIITMSSFALLKQLPISKRAAYGWARFASRNMSQTLQVFKDKILVVSFSQGSLKVHNWKLALQALFV
jgi:ubiquitin C-terminal hydrolase